MTQIPLRAREYPYPGMNDTASGFTLLVKAYDNHFANEQVNERMEYEAYMRNQTSKYEMHMNNKTAEDLRFKQAIIMSGQREAAEIGDSIQRLDGNLNTLSTAVEGIMGTVSTLSTRVGVMERTLTDISARVGVVETTLTDISARVGVMERKLTDLSTLPARFDAIDDKLDQIVSILGGGARGS